MNTNKKVITDETVRYVARLSRLRVDDADAHKFKEQLTNIIEYVEQLNEVDTEGIIPTTHVLPSMKNVFREDELKDSISPEKALQNVQKKSENFFTVPKIIKED